MSKIFKIFDIMGVTRSALGGGIPFASDAMFWLDGTIVGTDFVDKSGNGRDFAITGKDFDSDWTNGIPYKSAATIAAPAADAPLIAADINNFLYDSGGTPNQIPVVSFFQNIDYEDKLFCRHDAQVVDGNNAETYKPRVLDITLYENVKTGSDLTKCNIYFSVPTENATAIWVSPDGNDSTGDGSKSTPWLTLDKAFDTENSGEVIYAKSNDYVGDLTEGYIIDSKINSYKGLGLITTDNATISGALFSVNPTALSNIQITTLNSTRGIYLNVLPTVIAEKVRLIATNSTIGFTKVFKELLNCIATGTFASAVIKEESAIDFTVNTCFIDATAPYLCWLASGQGRLLLKNSTIKGTYSISPFKSLGTEKHQFIGNYFDLTACKEIVLSTLGGCTIFNDNTVIGNIITEKAFVTLEASYAILNEIKRNSFVNSGWSGNHIQFNDVNGEISNNIFNVEDAAYGVGNEIQILANVGTAKDNCHVLNNKILSKRTAQHHIEVGNESTSAGDQSITSALIARNYIKSSYAYSATSASTHSFFLGYQDGSIIHNYGWGCPLSFVLKGSGTYVMNSQYNVGVDCARGLLSYGCSEAYIVNNTIISKTVGILYGIWLAEQFGGDVPINCVVKNNIIINLVTDTSFVAVDCESATNVFDYNIYYSPNAPLVFKLAGVDKTFTEWQALGYDTNSIVLTDVQYAALFTDVDNNDFSLPVGSVAIGAGETLAATYDDGLDATTDWGNDTTVPSVVTKQQTGFWDIGAYVS